MALLNSISLRIYGGAQSQGFDAQPLVAVGAAPDGFRPMAPTIVDESQAWLITHAQGYTNYSLYTRDCQTPDGQPAQLMVCLFLPAQQKVAGGKSPLSLLDTTLDLFTVQVMQGDRLPAVPVDGSPFQLLMRRYSLEERPTLLPVMTGMEPAAFQADNMTQVDALMRYSRYPELARIARLEIGLHCPSTVAIPIKGKAAPKKDDAAAQQQKEEAEREQQRQQELQQQREEQHQQELQRKQERQREEQQRKEEERRQQEQQKHQDTTPASNSLADDDDKQKQSSTLRWLLPAIGTGIVVFVLFMLFKCGNEPSDNIIDDTPVEIAEDDTIKEEEPVYEKEKEALEKQQQLEEERKASEERQKALEEKQKASQEKIEKGNNKAEDNRPRHEKPSKDRQSKHSKSSTEAPDIQKLMEEYNRSRIKD